MQRNSIGLVVLAIVGIMGLVALVLLSKHAQIALK
jgi:hypothetical protein